MQQAVAALSDGLLPGPGTVFLAGGIVRDLVLGRSPRDIDLLVEGDSSASEFTLRALERLSGMEPVIFDRREPATWRVIVQGRIVDAGFCAPDGVSVALKRRDFTINALAAPLRSIGHLFAPGAVPASLEAVADHLRPVLVDPVDGLADLLARRLRTASPRSLEEDPLRLLRAVRMWATLDGFVIEDELLGRIARLAPRIGEPAAERIGSEMQLILDSPRSSAAVRMMDSVGLLDRILPELSPLAGVAQPPRYHDHDAREHSLRALAEAERLVSGDNPLGVAALRGDDRGVLMWAALLHDSGKAAAATRDAAGTPHFYGHEELSATLAEGALRRLRIPGRLAEPVANLIRWHLRAGALAVAGAGDRPVRRLVRLAGERLDGLLLLALADRRAAGGSDAAPLEERLVALCRRALEVREEVAEDAAAPPLLDGREIMEILDLSPGPRVGSIIRWLDRMRTERRLRTREEAVSLLRSLPSPRIPE